MVVFLICFFRELGFSRGMKKIFYFRRVSLGLRESRCYEVKDIVVF